MAGLAALLWDSPDSIPCNDSAVCPTDRPNDTLWRLRDWRTGRVGESGVAVHDESMTRLARP